MTTLNEKNELLYAVPQNDERMWDVPVNIVSGISSSDPRTKRKRETRISVVSALPYPVEIVGPDGEKIIIPPSGYVPELEEVVIPTGYYLVTGVYVAMYMHSTWRVKGLPEVPQGTVILVPPWLYPLLKELYGYTRSIGTVVGAKLKVRKCGTEEYKVIEADGILC